MCARPHSAAVSMGVAKTTASPHASANSVVETARKHIHTHARRHTRTQARRHAGSRSNTHRNTQTNTHTNTHTHTHTQDSVTYCGAAVGVCPPTQCCSQYGRCEEDCEPTCQCEFSGRESECRGRVPQTPYARMDESLVWRYRLRITNTTGVCVCVCVCVRTCVCLLVGVCTCAFLSLCVCVCVWVGGWVSQCGRQSECRGHVP